MDIPTRERILLLMVLLLGTASAVLLPRMIPSLKEHLVLPQRKQMKDGPLYQEIDRVVQPGQKSRNTLHAIEQYLERLRVLKNNDRSLLKVKPSLELLQDLISAHLAEIPFENLDVYGADCPNIILDISQVYEKIIERRRGGFCFEVNFLFGWLLRRLGFDARYAIARVWRGSQADMDDCLEASDIRSAQNDNWDGNNAPTHMVIIVHLDSQIYLCDVGFGDAPKAPLLIPQPAVFGDISTDITIPDDHTYRIWRQSSRLITLYRQSIGKPGLNGILSNAGIYEPRILFDLKTERPLAHFEPGLKRVLTDDNIIFRKCLLAVRHSSKAKFVLHNSRLRITPRGKSHDDRHSGSVSGIPQGHDGPFLSTPDAIYNALATHFNMVQLLSDSKERDLIRPAIDSALTSLSS